MNENNNINLPDQYRQIWDAIAALKVKKTKVMNLENEISTDRSHSLLEEYNEELSILTPKLEDLIKKINTNFVTLKEEIDKVERDITNINLKLEDAEVLGQNKIIDDMQHQKEKKILEKEKIKLQNELDTHQKKITEAELIIKCPNPEDQVKVIMEHEEKERAEKLAKEKVDREKKELEEKRKWDFQYQLDQKIQAVQKKSDDTINCLNMDITKYRKGYDGLKAENQLLKKARNELKDELEIAFKKAEKYQEKISSVHATYAKKIPCSDEECDGQLGYINICNVCGRDYETAKTAWENNQKIKELKQAKAKINTIFYIIFYIQILFGILAGLFWLDISISVIVIPIIIITIMIWRISTSKFRKEIIELKLGTVYDGQIAATELSITNLKEEIRELKRDASGN